MVNVTDQEYVLNIDSQVAHDLNVSRACCSRKWQRFRCFLLETNAAFAALLSSVMPRSSIWKNVNSMTADLNLIGHYTNTAIITSHIHLPYDKKSKLCSGL